ncbi:MAG: DEAD/DEAH box helicase, partial [Desulfobacterales bacterium]|nr:DEAD/DEAH box helicase [Desulfobacterales bacterium]
RGADVFVHHGSVSREERQAAEERFHHGENASIVCTSTLELGVDIGDLDHVFQITAPSTVSSFLQRLGRTGRRQGQRANTTFYCEDMEVVLQAVAIIELAREKWVESTPRNNRCWPVLVHQLLALTLQFGAASRETCREALKFSPDFAGISRAEFDHLVDHLVKNDFLYLSDGLLCIGDRTERVCGKKNFMELYAVFSSPQLYNVKTEAGHALGSLEQAFVDTLVEEMSSFLLSGRAWTVIHVNHARRTVRVAPAPRGRKPGWGGFSPQMLGFELCQKVEELLKTDREIPYMDAASTRALAEMREEFAPMLN